MSSKLVKRSLGDYPCYRISPGDTNYFALAIDPSIDGVPWVTVIEIFEPGGATPPNSHAHAHEMFYVLQGEGIARSDGVELAIKAGDVMVLPPGSEHVVENTGTGKLYTLTTMMPDEAFAALIRAGTPVTLGADDLAVLEWEPSMTLRRLWQEMTTKDFGAVDREHAVAILPVAAIEQHGPHLPVVVDSCINQGLLDLAMTLAPVDLPITVLPMQMIGKSDEHIAFPGTLTLSAETLTRLWTEIGESVHRAGIRRLVLLNSHGGQPQVMDIVARDLRIRLDMFVVTSSWSSLGLPPDIFPEAEIVHGIHGGAIETSLMLHFRPDLVRHELVRNFPSLSEAMAGEYKHLSAEAYMAAEGGAGFGWQTQDLNIHGACGDATMADAAKGRQIAEFAATRFVELLQEVSRFPLDRLKAGHA